MFQHLHSNMVLLKLKMINEKTRKNFDLHSNMVLLKLDLKVQKKILILNLHSNMVLLKSTFYDLIEECLYSIYIPIWCYLNLRRIKIITKQIKDLHSNMVLLKFIFKFL